MMYTCLLLLSFLAQVTADQLPCQDDYAEIVNGSRRCFRYYKCDRQVCNADMARRHCESQGAFLASDLTPEERKYFVSSIDADAANATNIFLGGRKNIFQVGRKKRTKTWLWADEKPVNGPWGRNEPKTSKRINCMYRYGCDKLWYSTSCHTKFLSGNNAYICERPPSYKGVTACPDGWTVHMGGCISAEACVNCTGDNAVDVCGASARLATSIWQSDHDLYLKLVEEEYKNMADQKTFLFLGGRQLRNLIWLWREKIAFEDEYYNDWKNGSPGVSDVEDRCLTLSLVDKKWHARDCTKIYDHAWVMCYRDV